MTRKMFGAVAVVTVLTVARPARATAMVLAEDESDPQFATVLRNPAATGAFTRALCEVGRSPTPDRPLTLDFIEPGRPLGRTPSPFVTVP